MLNRVGKLIKQQDRQWMFDGSVGHIRVLSSRNLIRCSDCLTYCGKRFCCCSAHHSLFLQVIRYVVIPIFV